MGRSSRPVGPLSEEAIMNMNRKKRDADGSVLTLGPLRVERVPELVATGVVLAAAGVSPLMFVGAAAGYGSMAFYMKWAVLPAIFVVIVIVAIARLRRWGRLYRAIAIAALAGPLSASTLDVVRVIGFRVFHAMPGSMPMLMGVEILNRFLLGPNVWSDIVGWADHILANGISFALVYVLMFGRPRWWMALPYAWVIATIFMISPVMEMLGGIGNFGLGMGPGFAVTVYIAHTIFGTVLGVVVAHWAPEMRPIWKAHFRWNAAGR